MKFQLKTDQAAKRLAVMGKELGGLFNAIQGEVQRIRVFWYHYGQLFETSVKRRELLANSGSLLWVIIKDALGSQMLLGVARLFDAAEGRKLKKGLPPLRNVSLYALIESLDDEELQRSARGALESLAKQVDTLKAWRDSVLAHLDHDVYFETVNARLTNRVGVDDFERVLVDLEALMNQVQRHYLNSEFDYRVEHMEHSAESLLRVLRAGLWVKAGRQRRLELGTSIPADIEFGDRI